MGLKGFWWIVAGLFLLRLALGFLALPAPVALAGSVLVSLLFVGLPVLAMFWAGAHPWKALPAVGMLLAGVAAHGGSVLGARLVGESGLASVLLGSVGLAGQLAWCLGLGVLIALMIRDKNLMLPVAIFLVGFDAFLVFSPIGPTRQLVEQKPELFQSVAVSVPQVRSEEQAREQPGARVVPMAFVGPADLLFIAAFLTCLHRFKMRVKETAKWLIPVTGLYLLLVIGFGGVSLGPISLGMLPALVPIGLTVLLVNRKEFAMSGEEKAATALITVVAAGLAIAGIYLNATQPEPEPPAGPATPASVQGTPTPAPSPEPAP